MFDEKNNGKRPELDAAWANETQRFETIFHHKDDPTTGPVTWDDVDEYPVDQGFIATQEDDGWDEAWDDFYLKANDSDHFDDVDIDEDDLSDFSIDEDDRDSDDFLDDVDDNVDDAKVKVAPAPATPARASGKGGKHAAQPMSRREKRRAEEEKKLAGLPEHMVKSRKTRKTLLLVLGLLVIVLGAVAVFATTMFATQKSQAVQETTDAVSKDSEESTVAEGGRTSRKTEVPNLSELFGLTQDETIEHLGHGATESGSYEVDEKDNPVKKNVSLILADEPSDTKSGTPTVFLGLNEDGKVVMAGYCAATASLGYGALSFSDLVENEHIVEQTLIEAGVGVDVGSVSLPDDPKKYQTLASDGVTLVKESSTFDGEGTANDGSKLKWSGVLTYDYSAANASGNLADTVRQVYIYVTKK